MTISLSRKLLLVAIGGFLSHGILFADIGADNPTGTSGVFNGNVNTACSYDPYTGNATRSVTDLVVSGGVGAYPLAFTRTMNSRYIAGSGSPEFGQAGNWRHSYQWSIDSTVVYSSTSQYATPLSYMVNYPDGRRVSFASHPTSGDPYFRGPYGVHDRLQPLVINGSDLYLILPDGGRIWFQASSSAMGDDFGPWTIYYDFAFKGIIDPYGQLTTVTYNFDGSTTIKEPAGRSLQLSYRTITNPAEGQVGATVLSSVQEYFTSTQPGRSVTYLYSAQQGGVNTYTALTGVRYFGDSSLDASYTYQNDNVDANGQPLISTCTDPMYGGPMWKIAYEFVPGSSGGVYGQIYREKHPNGTAVSTLSVNGNTRTETRGDTRSRTFTYTGYLLTSSTDFKNVGASQGYDGNSFVNSVTDRNGHATTFLNNSLSGAITQATHPFTPNDIVSGTPQTVVQYTYGSFSCPDPNNRDGNNPYYLYGTTNGRSYDTTYLRDANKRVIRITYPDSGYETFTYNNFGQVLTHRLTNGGTEAFTYDGRGLKTSYRDPYHDPIGQTGNPTAAFGYDAYDRVSAVTEYDANNVARTTTYTYDGGRGLVISVTHPDNTVAQSRYNVNGTLAWSADEVHTDAATNANSRTSYSYDDYKRIRGVTTPVCTPGDGSQQTTSYFYDTNGTGEDYTRTAATATWVVSPGQRKVTAGYDENLRTQSITRAPSTSAAATTSYFYDNAGNLTNLIAPNQQAGGPNYGTNTAYYYDERNRLSDVDDPISSDRNSRGHTISLLYDAGSNKVQQIRADNATYQWHYDSMNRADQTTGYGSEVTSYVYDVAGNVMSVTDANQHTYSNTYDLMNRRITSTYPTDANGAARGETWRYNSANDLDQYTNPTGQQKTLTYDSRHRFSQSWWGTNGQPVVKADYYGNSLPHDVWTLDQKDGTPITTVSLQYDGANNPLYEDQTVAGQATHRVTPSWDADGNRSNLAVTTNGNADINFQYGYTQRNQLSLISALGGSFPLEGYHYDANGNTTRREGKWFWAGTNYFYDALNRVTKCEETGMNGSNAPYARSQQIYDSVGRVTGTWRDEQATKGEGYGYNLRNQLTSVLYNADSVWTGSPTNPTRTVTYNVDPINRTSIIDNGTTSGYTVSALNQYLSAGSQSFGYDNNFNLTSATNPSLSATYDAQNRLLSMSAPGGSGQFVYDGFGRCVKRTVGSQVRHFAYEGWHPVVEYDGAGNYAAFNLYGAKMDEIVMRQNNGSYFAYSLDWQGNVFTIMDGGANIVEQYKYDAFGQPTISDWGGGNVRSASSAGIGNRFMFTGREYLSELGVYDYRNRFYHPGLGRFLQSDPIGFGGGDINIFRYCGGNPVNGSDPSGLAGNDDRIKKQNEAMQAAAQALAGYMANGYGSGQSGGTQISFGTPTSFGAGGPAANAGVPGGGLGSVTGGTIGGAPGIGDGSGPGGASPGGTSPSGNGPGGAGPGHSGPRGSVPGSFALPTSGRGGPSFEIDAHLLARFGPSPSDAANMQRLAGVFEKGATYYVVGVGLVASGPTLYAGAIVAANTSFDALLYAGSAGYVGYQSLMANPQYIVGAQQFFQGFTPGMGGATSSYYGLAGWGTRTIYNEYMKRP